jgi:hypothetical protein
MSLTSLALSRLESRLTSSKGWNQHDVDEGLRLAGHGPIAQPHQGQVAPDDRIEEGVTVRNVPVPKVQAALRKLRMPLHAEEIDV